MAGGKPVAWEGGWHRGLPGVRHVGWQPRGHRHPGGRAGPRHLPRPGRCCSKRGRHRRHGGAGGGGGGGGARAGAVRHGARDGQPGPRGEEQVGPLGGRLCVAALLLLRGGEVALRLRAVLLLGVLAEGVRRRRGAGNPRPRGKGVTHGAATSKCTPTPSRRKNSGAAVLLYGISGAVASSDVVTSELRSGRVGTNGAGSPCVRGWDARRGGGGWQPRRGYGDLAVHEVLVVHGLDGGVRGLEGVVARPAALSLAPRGACPPDVREWNTNWGDESPDTKGRPDP